MKTKKRREYVMYLRTRVTTRHLRIVTNKGIWELEVPTDVLEDEVMPNVWAQFFALPKKTLKTKHQEARRTLEEIRRKEREGRCIEDGCEEEIACNYCKKCQKHHDKQVGRRFF